MDQVGDIREKIDIVSLISEFIPLKRTGANFKSNCPFHNEKSPSFVVSPERQIWHCFGCGKGGDAYTFLMEYEHLEFPEALRMLAKRAGVELRESQFETQTTSKKEKIYKVNKETASFYHYVLTKHNAGKKALEYLKGRKLNDGAIETFQIGFAPSVGNALTDYLVKKKKHSREDLIDAGVSLQRGRDLGDFFKHRIIFPLIDHRGNIVGFSGRVLEASQVQSKYINTKDTLVYHKRDSVFGLNIAKDSIKKENQAILVEGEFDVISCFQEGITNVIAVKGTALTENHVKLLSRFTQKITMCFDDDSAGQEAMKKSLPLLEKQGLTTTVIMIPNGKDPDESIKSDPYAFKKAVKSEIQVYDYLLDKALLSSNENTADGKKKITDMLLPFYVVIENEIVKEHYLKKLAKALDTTFESIQKEIERRSSKVQVANRIVATSVKRSREELLEEYLLSLIIQSKMPKESLESAVKILRTTMSKERAYQKILHLFFEHLDHKETFDSKIFGDGLPQELITIFNTCFLFPLPPFENEDKYKAEIVKTATELNTIYVRTRLKVLSQKIKEIEKTGDEETTGRLQEEFGALLSLLPKSN